MDITPSYKSMATDAATASDKSLQELLDTLHRVEPKEAYFLLYGSGKIEPKKPAWALPTTVGNKHTPPYKKTIVHI